MENHRCKLCFRSFANGKALGGHMRSHVTNFYSAKSASNGNYNDQDYVLHSASSSSSSEPLSSVVSDTTNEDIEDVANCLMMLSRDKWGDKEEDYSTVIKVVKRGFKVRGGKYRCETCGRLFRSYQALGGHRASHKKVRVGGAAAPPRPPPRAAAEVVAEKVYECPFCDRVFSSGQALGGHKRTHFIGANVIKPFSRNGETVGIDLNLPAPSDDDEI